MVKIELDFTGYRDLSYKHMVYFKVFLSKSDLLKLEEGKDDLQIRIDADCYKYISHRVMRDQNTKDAHCVLLFLEAI